MRMIAFTVTAAMLFGGLIVWSVGTAQDRVTPFTIIIERNGNQEMLECTRGCNWAKATVSCDTVKPCRWRVDERGVQPVTDER